jgi:hypothetical protein
VDLRDEALRVDDVLDDLRREHDVERRIRKLQACRDLTVFEDVDLELVHVNAARLGFDAIGRVELDADELDSVVAAKAVEEHPPRAAEIEDAFAAQVVYCLAQHAVALRVAVLNV